MLAQSCKARAQVLRAAYREDKRPGREQTRIPGYRRAGRRWARHGPGVETRAVKLGEALLQALKDHGAEQIFGIPGDFALPFFKVVQDYGALPLYTLSHEPAVGFAADAAGRYSQGLGVAAVTYGAGALNMVNAVAGA